MAVTVTKAAPASTVSPIVVGSYGKLDSDTYLTVGSEAFAAKRVKASKLTLSSTYATNGFALTPADYGLKEIHQLLVICDGTSGGAAVPYLSTTGASPIVKLVTDNVPTELANATSVANHTYTVLLVGI